jgi:hypothetical protein
MSFVDPFVPIAVRTPRPRKEITRTTWFALRSGAPLGCRRRMVVSISALDAWKNVSGGSWLRGILRLTPSTPYAQGSRPA